jgi:sulfur-carrier protein adenylyltransferase/sulfurtransferase
MTGFSYDAAFDRDIGWVTEWEQQALRAKRVAIAGMGGVGGVHMLTLARFGVGAFNIADFDCFDIVNFNRQIGANVATIGRPKAEVLDEMAHAINPEMRVRRFDQGINASNVDEFLRDVDVFIDGFDFFVLDIRRIVYDRCAELGIPALCAAPIGMGVGFLAFLPGHMSFERYFRLEGQPETEQYLRFLVGLVPRGMHRAYLVDGSRLDLANKRGPSTGASCNLCASLATIAAVKLMLGRGGVEAAPSHHHYDPYVGRLVITRLRWGNAGPLQRLKLTFGRRMIAGLARRPPAPTPNLSPRTPLQEILHAARWAPSGDNAQPWRFEIMGDDRVVVHLLKPRDGDVYQYRDGEPTLLAGGALLECLALAAGAWGRRIEWRRVDDGAGDWRIEVRFVSDETVQPDPLFAGLHLRSVARGAYRRRDLSVTEKSALAASVGKGIEIAWFESTSARRGVARLGGMATDIRLRVPETFHVHQKAIDWERRFSPDRLPSRSLGLFSSVLPLMRWAMRDWSRLDRLNQVFGTWLTRLQLDVLPGFGCAAFFTMRCHEAPAGDHVDRLLRAGRAVQRFWLTAQRLGLAMQPHLAIIAFAEYGASDADFTERSAPRRKARRLASEFSAVLKASPEDVCFLGRIGEAPAGLPRSRSIRRSVSELSWTGD